MAGNGDGPIKSLFANKWLLAVAAIGILLLLFGASGGGSPSTPSGSGATPITAPASQASNQVTSAGGSALATAIAYENYYDHQLQNAIDQIAGISDATVVVSVDSTALEKLGQNITTSRQTTTQSGTGTQTSTTTISSSAQPVMVQGNNGQSQPLVIEQQLPHITGVLVIAKAADTVRMEAEVTNAVQDVLGIPGFDVTVLPRK